MNLTNIYKILFITLSNIGDVVLTLPVFSALRDNFPTAKIDVVVSQKAKDIFVKDPRINKIFVYDRGMNFREKVCFIKDLSHQAYDLVVDMRRSLIPILIRAKYMTPLVFVRSSPFKHKREIHLNRLRELGIVYKGGPCIYIDDKDRQGVNSLLEKNGVQKKDILIGVSPTSRSHLKQWLPGGFIEVINGLLKNRGYKIILIGDDANNSMFVKIRSSIKDDCLIDLTGKTNLNELFALIERLQLLLTGDSACMHIASDIGIKVVAIFGPTDPAEYGPTGKEDIVIRRQDIKCSPCKKAQCPFGYECMKGIRAEEVIEAVKELL